tara:strand:- start:505 stop:915 length:411 start_codon:yes stop_codon:yes gene_type:complete
VRSERVETNERPTRARVERKEQGRGEEGETSVSVNAHGGGEREDAVGVFARTRAGTKDDAKAVGDEGEGEGEGGCEIESVGRAVTGDEAGEVGEFQVLERAGRARGFGRGGVEEASDGERRGEFERINETKERRYE